VATSSLEYFVLDVFTSRRFEGNQLAVVINPGTLSTEQMQAIARETNLSETTFVERRAVEIEREEGVRVRIFTTQEELPFAGHPTLGTSSLLRVIAPECLTGQGHDTIKLALNVGTVPVIFASQPESAPAWPVRGEMTQRDPEFGEVLDKEMVAKLTNLSVDDFDAERPVQIVSTGVGYAIVPLRSAAALARLRVSQDEASAFLKPRGARWFYVLASTLATNANEPAWRARMQFNGGEDPATGSAAGCAISYLVQYGAVRPGEMTHLRQGVEIQRPSDLFLRADLELDGETKSDEVAFRPDLGHEKGRVKKVRVGGSTILVATGELFLP
jgi:trans-2,3-dihydro-3-hydroxyanthranilate isomerase